MDINDYHTDDNATLMTFKATTTATGALTENDDITITAGSAVFLNGATPGINLIQGFSNCTATSQVSGGGTILTVTLSNSVNATNTSSDSSTGNNISAIVCTVHNSTTFEFSIDSSSPGIATNGGGAGAVTFTMSTSRDTTPTTSKTAYALVAPKVSATALVPNNVYFGETPRKV
jgi:hypothetical protein